MENPLPTDPLAPKETKAQSLLDEIIQASEQWSAAGTTAPTAPIVPPVVWAPPTPPPVKKPRDPMTTGTILKMIGSLLFVTIIFFGSFLAYVVFNPDQAAFFVNIFGINPRDIQNLLKSLINGSFGITVLIFSIAWIMSLFRAIWTPRDQKRRRLISWLIAGVVGIFLFVMLAFWAYLFGIINTTNYANPGWDVSIYDNDLYTHSESREYAGLSTTTNLIGPITLRYDLSTNAITVAKKNLMTIDSYEIDFDGAKCINGKSIIEWSDAANDQWLICTFDEVRTYNIKWTYSGRDRLGTIQSLNMSLAKVEIKGLLDITSKVNKNDKEVITINAAKIKNLGNPRWLYSTDSGTGKAQSSITEVASSTPLLICLKLIATECDRYFFISDTNTRKTEGSIVFYSDPVVNPLSVAMTLTGLTVNEDEISSIEWSADDGSKLCVWTSMDCSHVFASYGAKTITAKVLLVNMETLSIEWDIMLNEPVLIERHGEVQDQNGKVLNTPETFDPALSAYVVKDIIIPTSIYLDAEGVVSQNLGYSLSNVVWRISHGDIVEEKVWEKIVFTLTKNERYTIEAKYTFKKNVVTSSADIRTAQDTIIIDLERKSLEPILSIQQSSDYVPSKVTVDASSSRSKNGTIQKFIFDFGEWKVATEWDAIQTYEYRTAGEKKITLTVIDDKNEKSIISKYVILKDAPREVGFTTSVSPGTINTLVDFISTANGDIDEWIWNFGDNTQVSRGEEVTHAFSKAGTYKVTLTVIYSNWTQKDTTQSFRVEDSLEQ